MVPVGVQKVYITVGNVKKTITEWAKEKGISASVISSRYKNGIRDEELFINIQKQKTIYLEIKGVSKPLVEWAKDTGLTSNLLFQRYYKGIR
ncbi:hypothetical protein [Neobacillus drentensis]|uniref:hypothetical protein n=1 Tax=Neobacillus drentensis TaxID=220684 RepID=UPI002FFE1319